MAIVYTDDHGLTSLNEKNETYLTIHKIDKQIDMNLLHKKCLPIQITIDHSFHFFLITIITTK